jgi:heme exporter protein CcmD
MNDFLSMGGYADFVWPSYALTIGIVVLNVVWARRSLTRASAEARRRLARKGIGS